MEDHLFVPRGLNGDSSHAKAWGKSEDKLLCAAALLGEFTVEDLVDCLSDPALKAKAADWLASAEREGLIKRYFVASTPLHVVTDQGPKRL